MPSTARTGIFVDNLMTENVLKAPKRKRAGRKCAGEGCQTVLSIYNQSKLCSACKAKLKSNPGNPTTGVIHKRPSTAFSLSRPTSTLQESPYASLAQVVRDAFSRMKQSGYREVGVYAFFLMLKEEGLSTEEIMGITLHKGDHTMQLALQRAQQLHSESAPFRTTLQEVKREWSRRKK